MSLQPSQQWQHTRSQWFAAEYTGISFQLLYRYIVAHRSQGPKASCRIIASQIGIRGVLAALDFLSCLSDESTPCASFWNCAIDATSPEPRMH